MNDQSQQGLGSEAKPGNEVLGEMGKFLENVLLKLKDRGSHFSRTTEERNRGQPIPDAQSHPETQQGQTKQMADLCPGANVWALVSVSKIG